MNIRGLTLTACLIFVASFPCYGARAATGVAIDGIWSGVSKQRAHTAYVYFTISLKKGQTADRLLAAASPIADGIDLLTPQKIDGKQSLEPTSAISVDPAAPTIFQPYGPHIILRNVKEKLTVGEKFTMTLTFEKAGKIDIEVPILAKAPIGDRPSFPKNIKLD